MASSSSQHCNYDVFLSFRGEDTRKTFVDHLYSALLDRKIHTYKDDEALPRGESIRPALFKAIKGSRIVVVIFSKKYADSSWCLEELAYIMKCKEKRGLIVMPVFYDVTPSEVRKQEGEFGLGFAKQVVGNINKVESWRKALIFGVVSWMKALIFGRGFAKQVVGNINKVESWRKALIDGSSIAGWEPKNIANGHEQKAIKEIVDTISVQLFSLPSSYMDEDLVGMAIRMEEVEAQLKMESGGVRMVGIWGIGGSGKTTLAESLCNKISQGFQGYCMVENIREESSKHGLKTLQEKLLSTILKTEMKLQSVEEGKRMISSRLSHSKVLILLDDVDHIDQLAALARSHHWFGSGSRIIITTRNEQLLISHNVEVCPVRLLSHEEAIKLFNKRAYNQNELVKDYETLSRSVVSYAAGLPLALKVLGSFLYAQDEEGWRSTLNRLKDNPEMEIVEKLKISYDGLTPLQKQLFLDIACFFCKRKTKEPRFMLWGEIDAIEIFEACGYHPGINIRVLIQKAFITVNFDMHDLIQDMGLYIVRGDHPDNPEEHSRIWEDEKMKYLEGSTKENHIIEAIRVNLFYNCHHICKMISSMKKLRWLIVPSLGEQICANGKLSFTNLYSNDAEGPNFLSNYLRYINWASYPQSPFPDSFQPIKLVVLRLSESFQEELWIGCKHLPNLKVLELKEMKNLLSTPDFDGLPSLQKLTLSNCEMLNEIHPSLGNHRSLEYISLLFCGVLKMFPMITQLGKLKTLKIRECSIYEFPDIKTNMEALEELHLNGMWIDFQLSSIRERCPKLISLHLLECKYYSKINEVNDDGLKHLEEFKLYGSEYYNLDGSQDETESQNRILLGSLFQQLTINLQKLVLKDCDLKDGETPSKIGDLFNLRELDLGGNSFTRLHFSLSQLTRLKLLVLSYCEWLVEFPELPSSLVILRADFCPKLKSDVLKGVGGVVHKKCKRLRMVSLTNGRVINEGGRLLESMLQGNANQNQNMILNLRGFDIVKRFTPPLRKGQVIHDHYKMLTYRMELPENWCNEFCGFLIFVVFEGDRKSYSIDVIDVGSCDCSNCLSPEDNVVWEESDSDSDKYTTTVWYVSFASLRHTAWWDKVYNNVSRLAFQAGVTVGDKSWFGVRPVPRNSESDPTQISIAKEESDCSHYDPIIIKYVLGDCKTITLMQPKILRENRERRIFDYHECLSSWHF